MEAPDPAVSHLAPRAKSCRPLASAAVLVALIGLAFAPPPQAKHWHSFTDPLFPGGDPWIVREAGYYYFSSVDCEPYRDAICIKKSRTLTGLIQARPKLVWHARNPHTQNGTQIWAPELHKIAGRWYIYYSADPDRNNNRHRLFVLRADSDDPLGTYHEEDGALARANTNWGIDPNIFMAADGRLYLTWSCTNFADSTFPQRICLARMQDAEHLATDPVAISTPAESWECRGAPIQEGPVGYTRNGITYITYSASSSWLAEDYAVGLLQNSTTDLLNPAHWYKTGPIFDSHGRTYGPGSVVFIPSPDEHQYWTFYHAIERPTCTPAYDCRDIRMQQMFFTRTGAPILGYPVNPGVLLEDPSGENSVSAPISVLAPIWGKAWGDAAQGLPTGQVAGRWSWTNDSTISLMSPDPGWNQIFRAMNPNPDAIRVRVEAQLAPGNPSEGTAMYGIYCLYDDVNNHAELLIDTAKRQLLTRAVTHGTEQRSRGFVLPRSFNPLEFHALECSKAGDKFTFSLDRATPHSIEFAQEFKLRSGQMGLLVKDAKVIFRNLKVN